VTLHTNYGDIKVEVFCDTIPVASEVCLNPSFFLNSGVLEFPSPLRKRDLQRHSVSSVIRLICLYYIILLDRNIKGFMIQVLSGLLKPNENSPVINEMKSNRVEIQLGLEKVFHIDNIDHSYFIFFFWLGGESIWGGKFRDEFNLDHRYASSNCYRDAHLQVSA
jgi:hypothetical protein